jgi:hypothetical protein
MLGSGITFSIVVSTKDQDDVLEERYEGEAPEDQGQHAEDLFVFLVETKFPRKCILVDVHWRYAEVAVHYTEALVCQ